MRRGREHTAAVTAARERNATRKAGGDRRVGRAIEARRGISPQRGGRAWINGSEIGGADPRYMHLSRSYDQCGSDPSVREEIDIASDSKPRQGRPPAAESEGRRDAEERLNDVAHAVRDHEDATRKDIGPASSADRRLYRRLRQALRR